MEERIKEAVLALAELVPSAAVIEELLDMPPEAMIANAPANVAWWLGYLQGAADQANVTVRMLLDEHGVSIDDSFEALPAQRASLPQAEPQEAEGEPAEVHVVLQVRGSAGDTLHVVDALLDAGFFQDAINEHDVDDAGDLHVVSAVVRTREAVLSEAGAAHG